MGIAKAYLNQHETKFDQSPLMRVDIHLSERWIARRKINALKLLLRFLVTRCDASELFKIAEEVRDKVPPAIQGRSHSG